MSQAPSDVLNTLRIHRLRHKDPPPWFRLVCWSTILHGIALALTETPFYDGYICGDCPDCTGVIPGETPVLLRGMGVALEVPKNFWAKCVDRLFSMLCAVHAHHKARLVIAQEDCSLLTCGDEIVWSSGDSFIMYNSDDISTSSWEAATALLLANSSVRVLAVRQLCAETLDDGKVGAPLIEQ